MSYKDLVSFLTKDICGFCVIMENYIYKFIFSCIQYIFALCVHCFPDCKENSVQCSFFWILKNISLTSKKKQRKQRKKKRDRNVDPS